MGKEWKLILMIALVSLVVTYGFNAWQNSASQTQ